MQLNIQNDYSELQSVALCKGVYGPDHGNYQSNDEEFTKYHTLEVPWDIKLLVEQQEEFAKVLEAEGVNCIWLPAKEGLPWQMYTRDVAFVLRDTLYYNPKRRLKERNGEVDVLLNLIENQGLQMNVQQISQGTIEGGDVMPVEDGFWVGNSSRTHQDAILELSELSGIQPHVFELGDHVMHLDTRLTQIYKKQVLAYMPAFNEEDRKYLFQNYDVIEITEPEMKRLASNVFVINPETIVVESSETRIQNILKDKGWNVKCVPYSEPIKLGGSFRCTTMPLCRA